MLTLILRPLLRLLSSPTAASAAASWGITALEGHVNALTLALAELDVTIAERRAQLAELDEALADRAADVDVNVDNGEAAAAARAEGPTPDDEKPCHQQTLHAPHLWHDRTIDQLGEDWKRRHCPGGTLQPDQP